jgi:hypothetical protein
MKDSIEAYVIGIYGDVEWFHLTWDRIHVLAGFYKHVSKPGFVTSALISSSADELSASQERLLCGVSYTS